EIVVVVIACVEVYVRFFELDVCDVFRHRGQRVGFGFDLTFGADEVHPVEVRVRCLDGVHDDTVGVGEGDGAFDGGVVQPFGGELGRSFDRYRAGTVGAVGPLGDVVVVGAPVGDIAFRVVHDPPEVKVAAAWGVGFFGGLAQP